MLALKISSQSTNPVSSWKRTASKTYVAGNIQDTVRRGSGSTVTGKNAAVKG